MKKFNKFGYIAIGMVLALIIGTATPVFAASTDVYKQLTASFTVSGKPVIIYINGTKLNPKDGNGKEVYPFIVDGTTYLPVRAISEALGKYVAWDDTTASVKIDDSTMTTATQNNATSKPNTNTSKQLTASFTVNGNPVTIYINGTKLTPKDGNGKNVAPFIVDGTTYLPVRAISEALGKTVTWDGDNITVEINDKADESNPYVEKDPNIIVSKDANGKIQENLKASCDKELDKDAVGKWEKVDEVSSPELFDPAKPTEYNLEHYSLNILDNIGARIIVTDENDNLTRFIAWTKGYLIDWHYAYMVSHYQIQQIGGKSYLFAELKDEDYSLRYMKPRWEVFEKITQNNQNFKNARNFYSGFLIDSEDRLIVSDEDAKCFSEHPELEIKMEYVAFSDSEFSPNYKAPEIVVDPNIIVTRDSDGTILYESMEYTFTMDEDIIGKWSVLDCVKSPDKFDPTITAPTKNVWPHTYDFYDDGVMVGNSVNAAGVAETYQNNWTKGYIVNADTVEHYEIKQIDGKKYLFMEFKNGDYFRGIITKPWYRVYEKTSDTPAAKTTK